MRTPCTVADNMSMHVFLKWTCVSCTFAVKFSSKARSSCTGPGVTHGDEFVAASRQLAGRRLLYFTHVFFYPLTHLLYFVRRLISEVFLSGCNSRQLCRHIFQT